MTRHYARNLILIAAAAIAAFTLLFTAGAVLAYAGPANSPVPKPTPTGCTGSCMATCIVGRPCPLPTPTKPVSTDKGTRIG